MLGRIFNGGGTSTLYNHETFYRRFEKDISLCQREAIIESSFITMRRLDQLVPILQRAIVRGVSVTVNTKPLQEQEGHLYIEAERGVRRLQEIGVEVLFTGGHHRKLAIFDRQILWEGSLNILSQNDSCEIMRRVESPEQTQQTLHFVGLDRFIH